jgi:hypothetical protein
VLNQDGYLYHSRQEGRSTRIIDLYELAEQAPLRREARRAVAQVPIPLLPPLPIQRKRASKKQKQLDQEKEEERQEQYRRGYREALAEDKFQELKRAQRQREQVEEQAEKESLERFRRRFAR